MAESSQHKQVIISDFQPGWVVRRGTAGAPNAPLVLSNVTVDEDGSLLARNGVARINTQNFGGVVHSHFLINSTRYIGVGTTTRRNMDPGVTIISGQSGARLTCAQMSPSSATSELWTYFANGDINSGSGDSPTRKKDNGTTTYNWGIDGPNSKPTTALSANVPAFVTIDDFDAAYSPQDTGTEAAALNPYSGGARTFSVTKANSCRFRRAISSLNLSSFGEDGEIRLMVRVSRALNIDHLEIAFDVNDGTFTKDYYRHTADNANFDADNIWQEYRLPKSSFERIRSSAGSTLTWSTAVAIQITIACTEDGSANLAVSADEMRLQAPTHPDGVMEYKMTWWSDNLKIRSNARSLADIYSITERSSDPLNVHRQRVVVTRGASTSDPQVTHWELWRRNREGQGIWQFVDRIPLANSTYNDDKADIDLGEEYIEDNTIPPPGRFVVHWDDRMFLIACSPFAGRGEEQAEYTIRYSARFRPDSFPIENYFLAGDPSDVIRGYAVWQAQLWIWTKRKVYRVNPVGDGYVAQVTEAPVGTESPYAIAASPYGIFYYATQKGPYLFNGQTAVPVVTNNIQPFFEGEVISQDGINIAVATPTFIPDYINIVGAYHDRFYYLVVDNTAENCQTIVYNADKRRWHQFNGPSFTINRINSERTSNNTVTANNLEAGTADGWLLLISPIINTPADPNNEPVEVVLQQTFDTIMKPADVEVEVKDIVIDTRAEGQIVLVEASFDDSSLEIIGAQVGTKRTRIFFPVNGPNGEEAGGRICYKLSVRVTIQQQTFRTQIFGIGVDYWPEPRRSTTYSAMYFFPRERGWARRGRLVLRSYATVTVRLVFDETKSYQYTLPNTNGLRLGFNPTNPTGLHGKVARAVLSSDQPFVLYPQSAIELGVFGGPAQQVLWQLQP